MQVKLEFFEYLLVSFCFTVKKPSINEV